jgi:hypothetical protein
MTKRKRTIHIFCMIAGMLMVSCCLFQGSAQAGSSPVMNAQEPIAPGVVHQSWQWNTYYGNINLEVLQCDLNDPDLDLRLVAGAGEYTKRATVSSMANRTNAVAMINGDFFNMALQGAPIGPSIVDGRLESSPAVIQGLYSLGIDNANTAWIEEMTYDGKLTAADGTSFPIDGLNKTYYWHDPSGAESHTDTIQLYNDFWGSASRGHQDNTEVLVASDGTVEQISDSSFPFEVPDGKYILQVNGSGEDFVRAHCPIGSKVNIQSSVSPDRNWKFLVGGHALLCDNGREIDYSKDISALGGIRARTAAAISQDGKKLWFVCAEGRTWNSSGIMLSSLGYFMQDLGAWRAVNLDGGGSTTMVLKHLGQENRTQVVTPESYAGQRAVVNGIGVYNHLPEGPVADFSISGRGSLVIGETAGFAVDRAWDQNLHAKTVSADEYTFSSTPEDAGVWEGSSFLALKSGLVTITCTHKDGASESMPVNIQGQEGLRSIDIVLNTFMVNSGDAIYADLYGNTTDGRRILLSPRVANWTMQNFSGTNNLNQFTVTDTGSSINGTITAKIGSLQGQALMGNGKYNLLDITIGSTTYWLNGASYTMPVEPVILSDRTYVPIRFVTQALGGQVNWDDKTRTVAITYKDLSILLPIDSNTVQVNGKKQAVDAPARIVNDRTMVPIRFVTEAMGLRVDYDGQTKTISITGTK